MPNVTAGYGKFKVFKYNDMPEVTARYGIPLYFIVFFFGYFHTLLTSIILV